MKKKIGQIEKKIIRDCRKFNLQVSGEKIFEKYQSGKILS
jgi:hypothetical protein